MGFTSLISTYIPKRYMHPFVRIHLQTRARLTIQQIKMTKIHPQLLLTLVSTLVMFLLVVTTTMMVVSKPEPVTPEILTGIPLSETSVESAVPVTCVNKCVPGTRTLVRENSKYRRIQLIRNRISACLMAHRAI